MAFCVKCGSELVENAQFCSNCGAPVGQNNIQEKFNEINNTNDSTASYEKSDIERNKWMAFLSYWSILVLIPLFVSKDSSSFVKFHVNQGLILLIAEIGISIISFVVGVWSLLANLLIGVLEIALIALSIIGMVNAYNGRAKELPFLGSIKILK